MNACGGLKPMGILVLSTATAFSHFSSEKHSPSWTDSMQAFHRLQFFKNCSNMGLYHRVQPFRDRLQQHGSPRGCSSYETSGSTTGSPWVAASGHIHVLQHRAIHGLWISSPTWYTMHCRGTAYSSMVPSRGCRGTSALVPGAPPPLPSSLTLVSVGLFLSHFITSFSQLLLCSSFFLFSYICSHWGITSVTYWLSFG